MSSSFSVNRNQIITLALRKCNALDIGTVPDPETLENISLQLNLVVKQLITTGLNLWKTQELVIPLTTSQTVYTLGGVNSTPMYDSLDTNFTTPIIDKPLKVIQGWYRNNIDVPPVDVPLTQFSKNIYNSLANKTQTGVSNSFMYDPKITSGNLYVYLTPDVITATNTNIHLVCEMPFQDVVTATTALDFPNEWLNALVWNLADQIAIEYGLPINVRQEIMVKAKLYLEQLQNWNVEPTSVYFSMSSYNQLMYSSNP